MARRIGGEALIDGELTTCLLDNGAQLNFVTPDYAARREMYIGTLDVLAERSGMVIPPIMGIGGIIVEPTGFVVMNVQVPCVKGYNEEQIAIVLNDPGMKNCPVILGTPTLYRVMEVIKESEISKLAIPWATSRGSWLMKGVFARMGQVPLENVANKVVAPTAVSEVVRSNNKFKVPPFGHKVVHGRTKLILTGYRLNVMTHGLEKRSPALPLGIEVQSAYCTLSSGSGRVTVVVRNSTRDWIEVAKGIPLARMESANQVPPITGFISGTGSDEKKTLSEEERQVQLLEKLDLSGLNGWTSEEADKARSLLREYHDLFSLEKHELGHTRAAKHKIVLHDPESPPFKECFRRIPPPQVDEVREHLKLMLDAGAIRPSNSPWCNAVVLVRKKDGSLRFCIDFRRLNALTRKDSHPLPRIGETLDSLSGSAYYSTFDLTSGFWQVPMDEASKQYTAFTLGSMGLFECERMPFGLCNAPATFQRLMQNCLGELNPTYCLIYLDDVIVYSKTPSDHLLRMRVVFDRLREHGLKLKPSKCDLFKTEINYLAHHVSRNGVLPSKRNLASIAECPPPDTYTGVKLFVGLVGHYRRFVKNFAKIAAPLYELTSGDNCHKKKEKVTLSPEALEAFERLKEACLTAPILSFPDFDKPFLLETDASGIGLGAVLSQKQEDGRYHPIAYASRSMNDTEENYHSNKKEFLALKWAVTEQFHEYLSPYGKNTNEFIVRTDNNPLTYIFSSAKLDAAGHRWVARLADYNFSLEYQKGKDNTVADFLSRVEDRLPENEVAAYLTKIPYEGVQAVLNNAGTPFQDRAEAEFQPAYGVGEMIDARPVRFTKLHVTDWQKEQKTDPVLKAIVLNLKSTKERFKEALHGLTDKKSIRCYAKYRERFVIKDGLLYYKDKYSNTKEDNWRFIVPYVHRTAALNGCHGEAAHQGQRRSQDLAIERFWWPGMCRSIVNLVKGCPRCIKYESAAPIAPLKPLTCSGPGELVHMDFVSVEESMRLTEQPEIKHILVIQDHFSKYVVAYVVKNETAETATTALRNGYFSLFGAPAYLVSDQGSAFTGHVIQHLCKLYGVSKLRTTPYNAQTNGQVERMNQTIIRMIGKLEEDKKARWSQHLPELLLAYNATRSAITGYSPFYLLFGRRPRIPVDYLFPTVCDPLPHQTRMPLTVATMQKRLREAFAMARQLTSEAAEAQRRYYDRKAGAVSLQPGDIVMVRTDSFTGKWKVKDRWEDGGYVIEYQLDEDWPVYRVKCPPSSDPRAPSHKVLHRNRLLLVPPEEAPEPQTQTNDPPTIDPNPPTLEAANAEVDSIESNGLLPSLVTRQGGDLTSQVWINGEFRTNPWAPIKPLVTQSPPDSDEEEISGLESDYACSDSEGT